MRNLIIFLCLIVFVLIYTGCAEKQITRSDGTASAQKESAIKQTAQLGTAGKSASQEASTKQNSSKKQTTRALAAAQTAADLTDIHFDYDRSNIRPEDRQILSGHAGYLLKNKNIKIVIEGNCDERGTAEYNLALGNRRAQEAKKFLVNSGVDRKRIETISYGMERPLDPAHNEDAWAKNRRDHFVVK